MALLVSAADDDGDVFAGEGVDAFKGPAVGVEVPEVAGAGYGDGATAYRVPGGGQPIRLKRWPSSGKVLRQNLVTGLMSRRDYIFPAILVGWAAVVSLAGLINVSWIQMTFNRSNWVKETCSKWAGKLITDEEMVQRFQLPDTVVVDGQPRATTGTAVLLCQAHGALSGL